MAADREGPPFLLRLFYRTGAFHRPDEFTTTSHLPKHISVYTWPSCTLAELSHHLAAASPPLLPDPAVGTRLSFRLIFADTRGNANQPPKYTVKDLGSLVIGGSGLGITDSEDEEAQEAPGDGDAFKTLGDSKLVVGDYVSVAILPPDTVTGAIAASGDARTGRGAGIGEARSSMGTMPPPFRDEAARATDGKGTWAG
ncbi:hypothetical protein GQ53DRAFT_866516 [Thozetella sp. PMI_491]|nr:hypothetical protein GQ53DRAFT_866516 [Thozetella sp. PMI_491]